MLPNSHSSKQPDLEQKTCKPIPAVEHAAAVSLHYLNMISLVHIETALLAYTCMLESLQHVGLASKPGPIPIQLFAMHTTLFI